VLEATDAQAQAALDSLKGCSLVSESNGGRVLRYAHNADRVLKVLSQSIALLTVMMLRGPQTPGELRIACDRMHNFADISSVEGFLEELAERPVGALVVKLARSPGEKRWAHLLSGLGGRGRGARAGADASLGEAAALKANVRLEAEVSVKRCLLRPSARNMDRKDHAVMRQGSGPPSAQARLCCGLSAFGKWAQRPAVKLDGELPSSAPRLHNPR